MKVLLLGSDGFRGWPRALRLSAQGHDVTIVHNLARGGIDVELECGSLTPIRPMGERLRVWREISGNDVVFQNFDVAVNYQRLLDLLEELKPSATVHFAEQSTAPYSMKSSCHKRYTVSNSRDATNNVSAAAVDSGQDIHVVQLGTMGVYGYDTDGRKLPEGYLKVKVEAENGKLVYKEGTCPATPGSIYHIAKTQDKLPFDFETVLNRFLLQAAVNYPQTIHGIGGQPSTFIHFQGAVKCIHPALGNPPKHSDRVRICNQMTETHRARDLAKTTASRASPRIETCPAHATMRARASWTSRMSASYIWGWAQ